jgi:hypothetical protein
MSNFRNLSLPAPKNESDFEELCLALWKRILKDQNVQFVGRKGQTQHGVDLIGRKTGTMNWIGIQCKVRSGVLSAKDLYKDVQKAKDFNPKLTELIFATTAPRDQNLQECARNMTEENLKSGGFQVTVFSWDDIEFELNQESNLDINRRFYSKYFIDYEKRGIAISRIVRVQIGIDEYADTGYDLLIGKTPSPDKQESYYGLDYWKGNYFIANWDDKTMDTFPPWVFPTDLEYVFKSKRDAFIISKWLKSFKSIDEIIYGDQEEHIMCITEEEYQEFLKSIED